MPRSVLITTASLVVLAGLGGFWLGQKQITLDTSAVIEAVARSHVEAKGGAMTDCVGLPGTAPSVLHVRCGEALYGVDLLGRVRLIEEGGI